MCTHGLVVLRPIGALLQIAYVHTGPMQVVFHSTHLPFEEWGNVVLVGAFGFSFAEVEKAIMRCFSRNATLIAHPPGGSERLISPCKKEPQT